MEQSKSARETRYSASTMALSPLVYGACISTSLILHTHIQHSCKENVPIIYRNLNLLLFGGAFFSSIAASRVGIERTAMVRTSSMLFVFGLGLFWVPHLGALYLGRLMIGLAAGIQSNVVPCYVSAIAPIQHRGTLASLYGVSVISGIILGYLLALVGVCIYSTSVLLAVICMSQLAMLGGCQKLVPARGSAQAAGFLSFVRNPRSWRSLVIIAVLHFAQHLSGINHILLKAETIFPGNDALVILLHLCVLALATSAASSYFSDRLGRAPLIYASCSIVISSCIAFYYAFYTRIFAAIFIVGYNVAISNMPFVLVGEIFPPEAVGHGAAFAASCNWLGAFVSALFLADSATKHNVSFLAYAAYQALLMLVIALLYRETQGKAPGYQ